MANVLDLNIKVENNIFVVELYDEREYFPFDIVQYVTKYSNIPRNTYLGIFSSQVIRFFKICNNIKRFKRRLSMLIVYFTNLSLSKNLLRNKFNYVAMKHRIFDQFDDQEGIISLFT